MEAKTLVNQGRLQEALEALQEGVRADPADAKLRIFLFQLLAVLGQWDRAMTQLNVAAEMDADSMLMAQACRPALQAEVLRTEIFAGRRSPMIFGEPDQWLSRLVQALGALTGGDERAAVALRDQAFEEAEATPCEIDGHRVEWLADGDTRLGPVLEALIEGRYYWVPMSRVASIAIEAPTDLRDLLWLPASFTWTNGGEAVGFLFARYPGSEDSEDAAIRLGRRTEWEESPEGMVTGLGQRVLAGPDRDFGLLSAREIRYAHAGSAEGGPSAEAEVS